jgi:hypothetical protein
MTEYPQHLNHHLHDYDLNPAHLLEIGVGELHEARDAATYAGDVVCAVRADNTLEDRGELGSPGRRRTCRACEDWADHVHDPLTGERMRVSRWPTAFSQGEVAATAHTAARVFALAAAAPAGQWQHLTGRGYRITVPLDTWHYEVILPIGPDHQPRPAYIDSYRIGPTGGVCWTAFKVPT